MAGSEVSMRGSANEPAVHARCEPRSRLFVTLAVAVAVCATLLYVATHLASVDAVPLASLLRDTTTTLDAPFHTGLLSNVGIWMWGACTSICLFTAAVVAARPGRHADGSRFFLAGAAVSAWLMADDALLLHEQVFPAYLGVPGWASLAIGFGATLGFLLGFRRVILASDHSVLLAALSFLAASAGLDVLHDRGAIGALFLHSSAFELLVEDGAKLIGIALWLGYFALVARDTVVSGDGDHPAPE